jgi:hypothetical protein
MKSLERIYHRVFNTVSHSTHLDFEVLSHQNITTALCNTFYTEAHVIIATKC